MGSFTKSVSMRVKKAVLMLRHRRRLYYSRKAAKRNLELIRSEQGKRVVSPKILKEIKEYARARYGSADFWPWLAVYTELRGEYVEGWVPDDFFSYSLLPCFNPEGITKLSICKTFDHRLFPGQTIEPVAVVLNKCGYTPELSPLTDNKFNDLLQKLNNQELVVKREGAPSGEDIRFAPARDITKEWFKEGENYVLQPAVRQHADLERLHPSSIATLRVTTFLGKDGSISVKHRSLRYGTGSSKVVNTSGMFSFISSEGFVSSNIRSQIGTDLGEKHPDSGIRLPGFKVPGLKEAVKLCKTAHYRMPLLRFIAWDLYVEPDGTPKLIEWNTVFPGMWENDALIGPLWSTEEIDEVLEWERRLKK